MKWIDKLTERAARNIAHRVGRRSFLSRLGIILVGTATIPVLPVARAASGGAARVPPQSTGDPQDPYPAREELASRNRPAAYPAESSPSPVAADVFAAAAGPKRLLLGSKVDPY